MRGGYYDSVNGSDLVIMFRSFPFSEYLSGVPWSSTFCLLICYRRQTRKKGDKKKYESCYQLSDTNI